jgi:hypothetical protein
MAEAAKSARGAFTDISSGAATMASETGEGFLNARAALGILDNSIRGNHAAAMADLIRLFRESSIVMAALPLAATAGGILLLGGVIFEIVKAVKSWREEQEKLKGEETEFGTSIQTVFNGLDEKILQAGIRADELRNNHLGALHKELELIDEQSMDELIRTFGEIDKAADVLFGDLKSHWYTFGIGSAGAQHALSQFKTQYDSLLAQGKDQSASDLLKGTLGSAEKVLALQKDTIASKPSGHFDTPEMQAKQTKYFADLNALKQYGVGVTSKELEAQEALVQALQAQAGVEEKVAALKKTQTGNATRSTGNEMSAQAAAAAKEAADHTSKMGELALAAEKEQASVSAQIRQSTIADRLASDTALAEKEYELQLQSNQNLQNALDKGGKDYNNQLKSLQDQAADITLQYVNSVASLKGKAAVEQSQKDIADMQEGEREKIDATQQGSAARLAAIDAAIKAEAAKNLQDTDHYRELMTQRVEVARQEAAEEGKAREDAGKKSIDNELKMALAAAKEKQDLQNSKHPQTSNRQMQEAVAAANQENTLKQAALAQQMANLDKNGKDYANKLKELQNQQTQLVQAHENEITAIKDKAEEDRNKRILSAEQRATSMIAAGLTQSIMGHQTWAHMITSFAEQAATGFIQNSLTVMMHQDKARLSDARKAATSAYATGESMGGPAGIVLGPIFGAAAFAGAMAFQEGGIVPGVGRGDIVPAMLEPGEGVVKNTAMDKLNKGDMGNSTHFHVQAHYAPHVHAVDATGVDKMLTKHGDLFQKHFQTTLRRMNK